jgi:subtilisin family serine protease
MRSLALALLLVSPASAQDAAASGWIVVFKDDVADPGAAAEALAASSGGRVRRLYAHAISGCALEALPAGAGEALARDPHVEAAEPDGPARASVDQFFPPWGLDRIDQRDLPLNNVYTYVPTGAGVRIYVIDSGIRITHTEFGGRASYGWDFVDNDAVAQDGDGHGTHVAGVAGGTTYGVAKGVSLVAVRVLDDTGSGFVSDVIAGVDWVTANAVLPAVANMSLGAGGSWILDLAVRNSVRRGITYCVAAGNDALDACGFSPAREEAAVTVGATNASDVEASFSNFGVCVDLLAPGVGILSSGQLSDSDSFVADGTSASAPFVSGAAALFLETYPAAMPWDVEASLLANATAGRISGMKSPATPNLLLYTLSPALVTGVPIPPEPGPPKAGYIACGALGIEVLLPLLLLAALRRRGVTSRSARRHAPAPGSRSLPSKGRSELRGTR